MIIRNRAARHIMFVLILPGIISCSTPKGVSVNFKNESNEMFKALELDISGSKYYFSNLASGSVTDRISVDSVYRYHYAKVITSTDTLVCQPIDFVGETAQKTGKVTLALRIDTINGQRNLVFSNPELTVVSKQLYEGHTTPADVVENLLVSINNKDWAVAQTYYAKDAVNKDNTQDASSKDPLIFFKNLFTSGEVYKILVSSTRLDGDHLHLEARMRKNGRSSEYPLCMSFKISGNRIVEQTREACVREYTIPTAARPSEEHDAALLQGRLTENNGCLTINDRLLVWPYGYTAVFEGHSIVVRNEAGARVAKTGDVIKVSGGEVHDVRKLQPGEVEFKRASCKGPGWIVGSVVADQ